MQQLKVLWVGLQSSVVNFAKWPELTPEKLEASFSLIMTQFAENGYNAQKCFTDTGETAVEVLTEALHSFQPDIILIGAGLRHDPDHLLLFEKLLNLIITESPKSQICFNSNPLDSVEAVKRWS